jgi:hypothetical protein
VKFFLSILASILGSLICSMPLAATDKKPANKIIAGWIENVRIYPSGLVIQAKLDSGAETSSLDARNLTLFKRAGADWVRFEVTHRDGQATTLERPVLRQTTIKRHFAKYQKRPVIKLGVCLGKFYRETEVNLVDRTGFQYPMLIGRKFMENFLVIDPALKFTVEPECGEQPNLE